MNVNAETGEGATRIALPGFGLALHHNSDELFPSASNIKEVASGGLSRPLTTLREFTIMRLVDQISDKPDWERKIFDETIVSKWKEELLETERMDISKEMVEYCIAELRYKARILEETKAVSVHDADVVKSDTIVPESLRLALRAAAARLEDTPADKQDWHPGSNGQVLDLVHPSLFPLVYGLTRILPDTVTNLDDCIERCGEGEVSAIPGLGGARDNSFSRRFQWLPCDVDISSGRARITSYINNLHPQGHSGLYRIIEEMISCSIPLWNMSLTPSKTPAYRYRRITFEHYEDSPGPDEYCDEPRDEWVGEILVFVQPKQEFQLPTFPERWGREDLQEDGSLIPEMTVDLCRDYHEKGLQVIVKLANIHLTPEKPKYPRRSWHVEGQRNEHICATALYYYDSHNISTSRLAFRQQSNPGDVHNVESRLQHLDWLWDIFGCGSGGPGIQHVGAIETREGRLITFPNILQHKVQPFELTDPTRPGHQKILALFLVDPNVRIISTANVPCQRQDWWRDHMEANENPFARLPIELRDLVFDQVNDPLSFEDAAALRVKLMKERKRHAKAIGEAFQTPTFPLEPE